MYILKNLYSTYINTKSDNNISIICAVIKQKQNNYIFSTKVISPLFYCNLTKGKKLNILLYI